MEKKEIYHLAVAAAGAALEGYFQTGRDKGFGPEYFQKPRGKPIAKAVYDILAEKLLREERDETRSPEKHDGDVD